MIPTDADPPRLRLTLFGRRVKSLITNFITIREKHLPNRSRQGISRKGSSDSTSVGHRPKARSADKRFTKSEHRAGIRAKFLRACCFPRRARVPPDRSREHPSARQAARTDGSPPARSGLTTNPKTISRLARV